MSGLIDILDKGFAKAVLNHLSPALPKHFPYKKWDDIKDTLQTGDIVLINGTTAMLKALGKSPFCHVGMIVMREGIPYLWESTYGWEYKKEDAVVAGKADGVHLIELWEAMTIEPAAKYCIRPLSVPHTIDQAQFTTALQNIIQQYAGRPYEENNWELVKAQWDGWGGKNKTNMDSVFCSELIAETYIQLGLMRDHLPSNEYTPLDFSSVAKHPLKLVDDVFLGHEYVIDLSEYNLEESEKSNGKTKVSISVKVDVKQTVTVTHEPVLKKHKYDDEVD